MSKTTGFLIAVFLIVIGILLFVIYGMKQNSRMVSFTKPAKEQTPSADTSVSLATTSQSLLPGQTVTIAVLIHNPMSHTTITQLEIAYDPNALTIDSIMPGSFFIDPTIALQNVDFSTGRISYALHCPMGSNSNQMVDCANNDSPTIAVITANVNPYNLKQTTQLSFLPKTLIRTNTGRDILQSTTGLDLTIGKSQFSISSASAGRNQGIHVTPNTLH
jgi:hypothetical protein